MLETVTNEIYGDPSEAQGSDNFKCSACESKFTLNRTIISTPLILTITFPKGSRLCTIEDSITLQATTYNLRVAVFGDDTHFMMQYKTRDGSAYKYDGVDMMVRTNIGHAMCVKVNNLLKVPGGKRYKKYKLVNCIYVKQM